MRARSSPFWFAPGYAERVAEPAGERRDGLLGRDAYSVNAARPGGGVYREWFQGWDEAQEWRSDDGVMPPCCQKDPNRTSLFIPYHKSFPNKGWWGDGYAPRNATLHHLWFCEEDDACANCEGDTFAVEAATCAAGRCESRATNGSCACESRAYEDTQGGVAGGPATTSGCRWRRDSWWVSRARRKIW